MLSAPLKPSLLSTALHLLNLTKYVCRGTKVCRVLTSRTPESLRNEFPRLAWPFQVVHTIRCSSLIEFQLSAFPRKELGINTRCQLVITMFLKAYQFLLFWQVTFPKGREQKGVSSWGGSGCSCCSHGML